MRYTILSNGFMGTERDVKEVENRTPKKGLSRVAEKDCPHLPFHENAL
jgi:hypothetical protein